MSLIALTIILRVVDQSHFLVVAELKTSAFSWLSDGSHYLQLDTTKDQFDAIWLSHSLFQKVGVSLLKPDLERSLQLLTVRQSYTMQ